MRDLNISYDVAILGISLYVLGFALGYVDPANQTSSYPLMTFLLEYRPLIFASMGEASNNSIALRL
jgi:hypothetical protein